MMDTCKQFRCEAATYTRDHRHKLILVEVLPGTICVVVNLCLHSSSAGLLGHFRPALPFATHELTARGLNDMERLTEPYIRKAQLVELFRELAEDVSGKPQSLS